MKTTWLAITIPVHGLSCGGGGVLAAERALLRTPGVTRAYVNPWTEMAYVEYEPEYCSTAELTRAIEQVGLRAGTPNLR